MNPHLLNEDDILRWGKWKRRADAEKWLKEQGIWYARGNRGALMTTLEAIQQSASGEVLDFGSPAQTRKRQAA